MEIIDQSRLDRFEDFFKTLKPSDNIALLHDTDPDGTTSGKIIYTALNRLGLKVAKLIGYKNHIISDEVIKSLQEEGITKLITTDKTVDSGWEAIHKIEKFADICVFDHHVIQNDISSPKTVFLKPQLIFNTSRPDQYCSAKFSYDLLNRIVKLEDLDWVCVCGIIGDMAASAWPEFVNSVLRKYNLESKEDIFQTKLGRITQLISFGEAMLDSEKCFQSFLKSKNINEALENLEKYKVIEEEVDYYYDHFDKLAVKKGTVYLLELKSVHFIKSIIASLVSKIKHPNSTVVVIQEINNWMTISARRNDSKVDMNVLLKKSLLGLKGSGGGHVPAAGASVSLSDFVKFKENLLKINEEMET